MRGVVLLLPLVVCLAGCADPYAVPRPSTVAGEQAAEHPVRDAPAQDSVPNVAALVRRAVDLTGNWTGSNVAARYTLLARLSVGDARRQARDAAARIPTDRLLSRPDSRSAVELEGFVRHRRTLLVVTRETLHTEGTQSRRYRVTRATIQPARGGWVLKTWEPQP